MNKWEWCHNYYKSRCRRLEERILHVRVYQRNSCLQHKEYATKLCSSCSIVLRRADAKANTFTYVIVVVAELKHRLLCNHAVADEMAKSTWQRNMSASIVKIPRTMSCHLCENLSMLFADGCPMQRVLCLITTRWFVGWKRNYDKIKFQKTEAWYEKWFSKESFSSSEAT